MSTETKQTPKKYRSPKTKNLKFQKTKQSGRGKRPKKTEKSISRLTVSSISDVMAQLRPKLTTLPLLKHEPESDDEFIIHSDEKKDQSASLVAQNGNDCKEMVLYSVSKDSLKAMLGLGHRGRSDMHMTFELFAGSRLTTPTAAGLYLFPWLLASSTSLQWTTILQALGELSSLDVLFDEFYVSKIIATYKPNNRYVEYIAGVTPSNLNNSAATVVFLPNAAGSYGSGANAWTNMLSATQSKAVYTGDPWKFAMHNPTKLDWNGPLMDQSSTASSMGWCMFSKIASYGGQMQFATPYPAAGVPSNVTWSTSTEVGVVSFKVTVHVRARA